MLRALVVAGYLGPLGVITSVPTFKLRPDYRQFYLLDEGLSPPYPEAITELDLERGLKTAPNLIAIYPDSDTELEIAIECHDAEPQIDQSACAHIAEGSLEVPSGRIVVATPTSYLPDCTRIRVTPGAYRVRVAAVVASPGTGARYLVSLWPGTWAPVAVLRSAAQHAA